MKIIKISLAISATLYAIVYIGYSFVEWEIKNPFQWIIDIPTYDPMARFAIMCCVVMYYGILFVVAIDISKQDK